MNPETILYEESYIILYTTFQKTTKFPEYFLATCKVQIEIIKAHGGRSGHRPKLMQAHPANIF